MKLWELVEKRIYPSHSIFGLVLVNQVSLELVFSLLNRHSCQLNFQPSLLGEGNRLLQQMHLKVLVGGDSWWTYTSVPHVDLNLGLF